MYTKVLAKRLRIYIETFKEYYKCFAAYLRWDSDSWHAVEIVSREINIKILNLAPKHTPKEEVEEVSLGGLYEDPDLVLITPSSTSRLRSELVKLINLYLNEK